MIMFRVRLKSTFTDNESSIFTYDLTYDELIQFFNSFHNCIRKQKLNKIIFINKQNTKYQVKVKTYIKEEI